MLRASSRIGLPAFAIGLLSAVAHRAPAQLIDPPARDGAAEIIAAWIARAAPHTSPFVALHAVDVASTIAAMAGLVAIVWRLTRHVAVTAAIGMAAAATLPPVPALRPFHALAPLLAVAACAVALDATPNRRRRDAIAGSALIVAACVWWLPQALARPSLVIAGLGGALARAASTIGPYVCALAALGAFTCARRNRLARAGALLAFVLLLTALDETTGASSIGVVIWLAASVGLIEILRMCRPSIGGRLAAMIFVVLVPLLQWQDWWTSRPQTRAADYGHERLSLDALVDAIDELPADAALATEDASTHVLLRAARARANARVPPAVGRDAAALRTALATRTVFAMPRAQAELQDWGFRLEDTQTPGLARVSFGGECRAIGDTWRPVDDLESATAWALVARTPSEAGPVVVYAGFDARPHLETIDWPPAALRGLWPSLYVMSSAVDRAELQRVMKDDDVPVDRQSIAAPFVGRLRLWRTPDAPARLSLSLGAAPRQIIARVVAAADPKYLTLCPAFPHAVRSFDR